MNRKFLVCPLVIILLLALSSAQAGTKEELAKLQNDVLALQKQMREFERTFNEKIDGIKSLVEQMNDHMAESNIVMNKFTTALENQVSGIRPADQTILQEIRILSGKIDDTATRISALAQQLSELKVQSKPLALGMLQDGSIPAENISADSVYDQAFKDLVQGNFDLAIQGFKAYLSNFPSGERAAFAQYNIGEAYYNQKYWPQAVDAFSRVINEYPAADRIASAYFKRGKAELSMRENDKALADFKTIVEKFPESPEAGLAMTELQNLGVRIAAPSKNAPRKSR